MKKYIYLLILTLSNQAYAHGSSGLAIFISLSIQVLLLMLGLIIIVFCYKNNRTKSLMIFIFSSLIGFIYFFKIEKFINVFTEKQFLYYENWTFLALIFPITGFVISLIYLNKK